jgi:hypothetical protein
MNLICARWARTTLLAAGLGLATLHASLAGPGAHGPNGEHLDAAHAATQTGGLAPRLETHSETYELVARLEGGELSILIDRYETNEPVLQAAVEVEVGTLKAVAKFHADHGDYSVDDPAMLKRLATPGEHPVLVTVVTPQGADLLDGVLQVGAGQAHAADAAEHGLAGHWPVWVALPLIALMLGLVLRWQRRRKALQETMGEST